MFVLEQAGKKWIVRNTETGAATVPMTKTSAQNVLRDLRSRAPVRPRVSTRHEYTAADVLAAADKQPRMFGGTGRKVYISDVLRALPGLTKKGLLEMHKRGEIELTRLDLVAAAGPEERPKIAASEIRWFNAELHLITPPTFTQRVGGFLGR